MTDVNLVTSVYGTETSDKVVKSTNKQIYLCDRFITFGMIYVYNLL